MKICPECLERVEGDYDFCPEDGTRLRQIHAREEDPMEGRVLDEKWLLESRIGGGGMGTVYRAHQLSVDRTVAIKVLRSNLVEDDEHVERFFREANVASNITDPRCVTIYDFGQTAEDHVLYLAMEYLEGDSLQVRVERERLTFEETIQVGIQICRALSHLHGHGVIHRDLKPENVFLVDDIGEDVFLKLVDFGLAKVAHTEETPVTATGKVYGTPAFMSPEQCMGSEIGFETDLYALGCLLYQLVAGRTPFEGSSSVQILLAQVNKRPPPVDGRAAIPSAFSNLIEDLLEKDPAKRPPTAEAVRERLEDIEARITGRTASQKPAPDPDRIPMPDSAEEGKQVEPVSADGGKTTQKGPVPESLASPSGDVDDGTVHELTEEDEVSEPRGSYRPTETRDREEDERGEAGMPSRLGFAMLFLAAAGIVIWLGVTPPEGGADESTAKHEKSATQTTPVEASLQEIEEVTRRASSRVSDAVASLTEAHRSGGRHAVRFEKVARLASSEGKEAPSPPQKSGSDEAPPANANSDSPEALLPVLTKEGADRLFKDKSPEVRKCFEKGLGEEDFSGGAVRVKVVVGSEGEVARASIAESDVGLSVVEDCIEQRASSWTFPRPPQGGSAVLIHEYGFEWKQLK